MKCPHCLTSTHEGWGRLGDLGQDRDYHQVAVTYMTCPECKRHILRGQFVQLPALTGEREAPSRTVVTRLLYPRAASRAPAPPEVPDALRRDYLEACLVLADSPKASAALSRRCLQTILIEKAGVQASNLGPQIEEAMPSLPSHLADAIDAVRWVGNFAAHPIKSESTGELADVEDGEAEWLLDVLDGLFDHYFVQPTRLAQKRAALNAKLKEHGRPMLKGGETASET